MILAAALAASACVADATWRHDPFHATACPQVYSVHGGVPTDRALDVVFLPAGFTEAELDVFRCGVALTVQALFSRPPFDAWACSINAWRIDLADTESYAPPATCGGTTCTRTPPVWTETQRTEQCAGIAPAPATGAPDAAACLTLPLDARGCPPGATSCRLIWPGPAGMRRAWRLAACAPAFDVVVVVVNSGDWAGGGAADMSPPLVVASLNGISSPQTRARMLAHELGHALGLLDEYAAGYPDASGTPTYHANRNVAKSGGAVPWTALCGASGCTEVRACPAPQEGATAPPVGLYEGAFYQSCGYYRASEDCAMEDPEDDFCPACAAYVSKLLGDMGLQRCK